MRFASRAKIVKNKPIINELQETIEDSKIYKKQLMKIREDMLQRENDIKLYAKKQMEMQRHLNSSNNMNAKLMNEIQFLKQVKEQDPKHIHSHDYSHSKEHKDLVNENKQERMKNLELFKELEYCKNKLSEWEQLHNDKQKQDAFETMIVLIEQLLESGYAGKDIHPQQRSDWEDQVGSLLNDYQDDVALLQDKYLQQL